MTTRASRLRRRLSARRLACVTLAGILGAVGVALVGATPAGADAPATVRAFGAAAHLGAPTAALNAPIVGIGATHSGHGYWLLAQDGGIFSYGDAHFYGSTGAMHLNQPVVGIAPTPHGHGYWLVASDGGIFSFGDAHFYGSTGALHVKAPIVGMTPTVSGHGYWLVASDGGIFSFGDARFHGSTGGQAIGTTIAGMARTATGHGYWLAGANGRVWAFGDAHPMNAVAPSAPITGIERAPGAAGVWLVGLNGSVYARGTAIYYGGATDAMRSAVGIVGAGGHGYWIATVPSGPPLPANSGTGRRIVYSNHQQRLWLVEANGVASHSFAVSGRHGLPAVGTYHVYAKLPMNPDGSLVLPWSLKFDALPSGGVINIHGIPLTWSGVPIEDDSLLGTPQSHGCLRLSQANAKTTYDWAPIGTPVVVVDLG